MKKLEEIKDLLRLSVRSDIEAIRHVVDWADNRDEHLNDEESLSQVLDSYIEELNNEN